MESTANHPAVEQMTVDEARALTNQIKTSAAQLWELVITAYRQRIWVVLGYNTWTQYCRHELSGMPMRRMSPDERIEIVSGLRVSGMSIRAIASAVGTGTRQVQDDLKSELCSQTTVQPDKTLSEDGKIRPAKAPAKKKSPTAPTESNVVALNPASAEKPKSVPNSAPSPTTYRKWTKARCRKEAALWVQRLENLNHAATRTTAPHEDGLDREITLTVADARKIIDALKHIAEQVG